MREDSVMRNTDLGVLEAFEEGGDADESDVVIPHYGVFFVVTRDFEDVLEDYNQISKGKLCQVPEIRERDRSGWHTFEAFSTRLLKKALFLAIIRNVTTVFRDLAERVDLELLDLAQRILVESLKRWVFHIALNLTLSEHCAIFRHLLLLDDGDGIQRRRLGMGG
jgi:hypothetical protein